MKMALRLSLPFLLAILGSSCASTDGQLWGDPMPPKVQKVLLEDELAKINAPNRVPVVAIYRFRDLTGQKRQNAAGATSFSSAVTQAPEVYLLRALVRAGDGQFFKVIDRTVLDDLTRERQLIRQTRQSYDGSGATKLPALTFAGLLVTGGVVGYDHSVKSGGVGARYLGIGSSKQFSSDTVTVNIRMVSVATGEVVLDALTSKTILSTSSSGDVFRFIEQGTELVELENGWSRNESVSVATQRAIEMGVLELIRGGKEHGYWSY